MKGSQKAHNSSKPTSLGKIQLLVTQMQPFSATCSSAMTVRQSPLVYGGKDCHCRASSQGAHVHGRLIERVSFFTPPLNFIREVPHTQKTPVFPSVSLHHPLFLVCFLLPSNISAVKLAWFHGQKWVRFPSSEMSHTLIQFIGGDHGTLSFKGLFGLQWQQEENS